MDKCDRCGKPTDKTYPDDHYGEICVKCYRAAAEAALVLLGEAIEQIFRKDGEDDKTTK